MTERLKTVGVIGGMGAAATLDFYAKLLAAATPEGDQNRLRILIDCDPLIPDRNDAIAGFGPSPGPRLAEIARGLERSGAEFLVMPCNTAHAFVADILAATDLPFVDLLSVTVDATKSAAPRARQAGVLATTGTVAAGLYQKALGAAGITAVVPQAAALERFMGGLYAIKSGDTGPSSKAEMKAIAAELIANGAQAIIAGCTEVPLVLAQEDLGVPFISSTDALVAAALHTARG